MTESTQQWSDYTPAPRRPGHEPSDEDFPTPDQNRVADGGRHASPPETPEHAALDGTPEAAPSPESAPSPDSADGTADHRAADETPDPAPVESLSLQAMAEAVRSLTEALEASRLAQKHQRGLLDKLHEERQQLREAEQRRLRDPVLRELIQLSDTCTRNSRQWRERADVSTDTADKVCAVLLEAADDVRLTLERQGVEAFSPLLSDKFDRSEAKAVGSTPTTDPAQDGLVAEVRKQGYRIGDRILRFGEVVVWRLAPTDAATGQVNP